MLLPESEWGRQASRERTWMNVLTGSLSSLVSPLESTWKAFWDKCPGGSLMWRCNLSIFSGDFAESVAYGWHRFFFTASPASSVSNLIQTASLIVQYLQRGLNLDSAFSKACWEAYVRSQASPANQQVCEVSDTAFCSTTLQEVGGCSAGSNFNGLRELTCSYTVTDQVSRHFSGK